MTDATLYSFPGACSRVTMTALEQAGVGYATVLIDASKGETRSSEFLKVNPYDKVPALSWNGRVITENVALILFLSDLYPDAGILPKAAAPVAKTAQRADLCWCSSTFHPVVRQIAAPQKWTVSALDGVRQDGMAKLAKESARIVDRVGEGWWYGTQWSIMDAYICWVYASVERGGFPVVDHPELAGYLERSSSWPAYKQAVSREISG